MEFDTNRTWYHGSPLLLTTLRAGSTITQKRELARVFSHKPSIVSVDDDAKLKHNGIVPGYLYIIVDKIQPEDIVPHPQTTMEVGDEWLTTREFCVHSLGPTEAYPEEQLSIEELEHLLAGIPSGESQHSLQKWLKDRTG